MRGQQTIEHGCGWDRERLWLGGSSRRDGNGSTDDWIWCGGSCGPWITKNQKEEP